MLQDWRLSIADCGLATQKVVLELPPLPPGPPPRVNCEAEMWNLESEARSDTNLTFDIEFRLVKVLHAMRSAHAAGSIRPTALQNSSFDVKSV
jgi:hypothetical protein